MALDNARLSHHCLENRQCKPSSIKSRACVCFQGKGHGLSTGLFSAGGDNPLGSSQLSPRCRLQTLFCLTRAMAEPIRLASSPMWLGTISVVVASVATRL